MGYNWRILGFCGLICEQQATKKPMTEENLYSDVLPDAYIFLECSFAGQFLLSYHYLPPDNSDETQPPIRHPVIPASRYSQPHRINLCNKTGNCRNGNVSLPRLGRKKALLLPPCSLLDHFPLGKVSCHVMQTLKEPYGDVHVARN